MRINPSIGVLGASNLDITGFPEQELVFEDANIGYTKTSPGGVGRNIAENLIRLGFTVDLISVFGDDPLSKHLIQSCESLGLDTQHSVFLKEASTATFLAIMNAHNDLALGISAMAIYNELHPRMFASKITQLQKSELIVLETNFSKKILEYITKALPNKKFILDTVSGKKALRSAGILSSLYILKTNLLEAQMLSGLHDTTTKDTDQLVRYFLSQGVKNVFITLGKNGVTYGNNQVINHLPPIPSSITNTIGAGDSFVSGIIYAETQGMDIHQMALYGMASASINVQYNGAVSPEMTAKNLEQKINNLD